jgi:hypothetical protein
MYMLLCAEALAAAAVAAADGGGGGDGGGDGGAGAGAVADALLAAVTPERVAAKRAEVAEQLRSLMAAAAS